MWCPLLIREETTNDKRYRLMRFENSALRLILVREETFRVVACQFAQKAFFPQSTVNRKGPDVSHKYSIAPTTPLSFRYHVHFDAHRCICVLEPSHTKTCLGYDFPHHISHLYRISAIPRAVIVWITRRIRGQGFLPKQSYNNAIARND